MMATVIALLLFIAFCAWQTLGNTSGPLPRKSDRPRVRSGRFD